MESLPDWEIIDNGTTRYLVFKNRDLITMCLRSMGTYEQELAEASRALLAKQPPGTVVDIGANLGTYTIPLAQSHPRHQFQCFEAQRIVYYQLCANIVLNGLLNVTAHHLALTDKVGSTNLTVPDYTRERNIGAFSMDAEVRAYDYECATVGGTEDISTTTLDTCAFSDIRLIKLDVEGLELDVLRAGTETLAANSYPPIIYESWTWKSRFLDRREALARWLATLGYSITEVGNNNIAQHRQRILVEFEIREQQA